MVAMSDESDVNFKFGGKRKKLLCTRVAPYFLVDPELKVGSMRTDSIRVKVPSSCGRNHMAHFDCNSLTAVVC